MKGRREDGLIAFVHQDNFPRELILCRGRDLVLKIYFNSYEIAYDLGAFAQHNT
jgi:hypothetical protein